MTEAGPAAACGPARASERRTRTAGPLAESLSRKFAESLRLSEPASKRLGNHRGKHVQVTVVLEFMMATGTVTV